MDGLVYRGLSYLATAFFQKINTEYLIYDSDTKKVYEANFKNYIIELAMEGFYSSAKAVIEATDYKYTALTVFNRSCICMNKDEYTNFLKYQVFGGTIKSPSDFISVVRETLVVPKIDFYKDGIPIKFRLRLLFDVDRNITNAIIKFTDSDNVDITEQLKQYGYFDEVNRLREIK